MPWWRSFAKQELPLRSTRTAYPNGRFARPYDPEGNPNRNRAQANGSENRLRPNPCAVVRPLRCFFVALKCACWWTKPGKGWQRFRIVISSMARTGVAGRPRRPVSTVAALIRRDHLGFQREAPRGITLTPRGAAESVNAARLIVLYRCAWINATNLWRAAPVDGRQCTSSKLPARSQRGHMWL